MLYQIQSYIIVRTRPPILTSRLFSTVRTRLEERMQEGIVVSKLEDSQRNVTAEETGLEPARDCSRVLSKHVP